MQDVHKDLQAGNAAQAYLKLIPLPTQLKKKRLKTE